jgi:hypothetical protein
MQNVVLQLTETADKLAGLERLVNQLVRRRVVSLRVRPL